MQKPLFKIMPLETKIADSARRNAASGTAGSAVITADSPNAFPCRHCLRFAEPGERVVLFTHTAIPESSSYCESGPIFVHLEQCERYAATDEYPAQLRNGRAMRAYNSEFEMIDASIVDPATPESVIAKMFENPKTAFVDARSVTRGCFTFRVVRS
jgi:hypothetical protein